MLKVVYRKVGFRMALQFQTVCNDTVSDCIAQNGLVGVILCCRHRRHLDFIGDDSFTFIDIGAFLSCKRNIGSGSVYCLRLTGVTALILFRTKRIDSNTVLFLGSGSNHLCIRTLRRQNQADLDFLITAETVVLDVSV